MTRLKIIVAGLVVLQLSACAMFSGDQTRIYGSLDDEDVRLAAADRPAVAGNSA